MNLNICLVFTYTKFKQRNRGSAIGSDATAAQSSRAITSIAAYSKGFAMALGRGLVNVYDRTEDKSYFRKSREIKVCLPPAFSVT